MGGGSMGPTKVDLLILGAGWTSTFLIPLLEENHISYAATSTTGREGTYRFKFEYNGDNGSNDEPEQYAALPSAKTILITFPLKGQHQSSHLRSSYLNTHDIDIDCQFIQLGSTGIFTIEGQDSWVTRKSKYDRENARAIAEDELLCLGGCVLNLSGLWGDQRHPKHWVSRVADTKEKLAGKTSLHLVHGLDVSRAIIAVHHNFHHAKGERFMLTDLMVHDWWTLVLQFAGELKTDRSEDKLSSQIKWVGELMTEKQVRALPRTMEQLGRCYDTREFWTTFKLMPIRSRI